MHTCVSSIEDAGPDENFPGTQARQYHYVGLVGRQRPNYRGTSQCQFPDYGCQVSRGSLV